MRSGQKDGGISSCASPLLVELLMMLAKSEKWSSEQRKCLDHLLLLMLMLDHSAELTLLPNSAPNNCQCSTCDHQRMLM